jgi:hypothetical protein
MSAVADAPEVENLLIDLREVTFIEPIALLYLFSTLVHRAHLDLKTLLELPKSQKVRDIIRVWNLPEALKISTGKEFHEFVASESRRYFGEKQIHYTHARANNLEQYLASQRFFGLTARQVENSTPAAQLVEREWSRWRGPLILRILNRHLRGSGRDIARVVIYELLTNAVQHPGATTVAVVSKAYGAFEAGRYDDRSFEVGVWDNGESIVETLRTALKAGGEIRAGSPSTIDEFHLKAVDWEPEQTIYQSDWTPGPSATNSELLLASLFQGISQKPFRRDIEVIEMPGEQRDGTRIGDGLHALYRSAIDDFGGSIAIRSGDAFMNVRALSETENSYRVKLQRYPGWPPFSGNMVTVRIPISTEA